MGLFGNLFTQKWEVAAKVMDIEAKLDIPVVSNVKSVFGTLPELNQNREASFARNTNWVWVAADKIAKAASGFSQDFTLYRERAGDDEPLPYTHYLYQMIYNPNPSMSWARLVDLTFRCQYSLLGNAYWYCPPNVIGRPAQFYFMQPRWGRVEVKKNEYDEIIGYVLHKNDGTEKPFNPDQIMHFKYPTIDDPNYGKSPGMAFAENHELDVAIKRMYVGVMQNGGFLSYLMSPENGWSKEQANAFRKEFNETFTAGPFGNYTAAGQILLPSVKMNVERLTYSPKDMESNTFLDMTRDQIKDAYGLPKIDEAVNRSVAEAGTYFFYSNTVQPALNMFADDLTQMFIKKYEPDVYMKFDGVVPEDKQSDAEYWGRLVDSGQKTVNEARASRGDKPVAGGDETLINSGKVPLSRISIEEKPKKGNGNENNDE